MSSPPAIRTAVRVPLRFGDGYAVDGELITFDGLSDGREHLAIGLGAAREAEVPLVRPHSECLTGDVFGSARCDCGAQLRESVERIAEAGGWLLYLRQEGRGIGLYNKLDAYALQDAGLDTYEANHAVGYADDERDYVAAREMLRALGVDRADLLTNNPEKPEQLRALGLEVRAVLPTSTFATPENRRYLEAKAARTGHTLSV